MQSCLLLHKSYSMEISHLLSDLSEKVQLGEAAERGMDRKCSCTHMKKQQNLGSRDIYIDREKILKL